MDTTILEVKHKSSRITASDGVGIPQNFQESVNPVCGTTFSKGRICGSLAVTVYRYNRTFKESKRTGTTSHDRKSMHSCVGLMAFRESEETGTTFFSGGRVCSHVALMV